MVQFQSSLRPVWLVWWGSWASAGCCREVCFLAVPWLLCPLLFGNGIAEGSARMFQGVLKSNSWFLFLKKASTFPRMQMGSCRDHISSVCCTCVCLLCLLLLLLPLLFLQYRQTVGVLDRLGCQSWAIRHHRTEEWHAWGHGTLQKKAWSVKLKKPHQRPEIEVASLWAFVLYHCKGVSVHFQVQCVGVS